MQPDRITEDKKKTEDTQLSSRSKRLGAKPSDIPDTSGKTTEKAVASKKQKRSSSGPARPSATTDKEQSTKGRPHKYAAGIGALFVLFAVIGVITIVIASVQLTQRFLDNTKVKDELADKIQPVLMFDPVPFESAADLDNNSLLFYSMWTTLSSQRAADYPTTDIAEILIPASDLDVAAFSLFGDTVTLEHKSFGDDFARYIYDEETATYVVPPINGLYVYTASILQVEKDKESGGELYNVRVGYLPPQDAWTSFYAGGSVNEIDKSMIYLMERDRDDWRIIKVMDDPESPSLERVTGPDGEWLGQTPEEN